MSKTINTRTKYRIVGADYSAQEPRMTAHLSSDENMLKAYNEGKDLYAIIAQSAYDNNYEDNLEFWPEGTEIEVDGKKVIAGHKTHLNKAGKERRSTGKVLLLASTYGMSGATAGARMGKSKEEGQQLLDNFFKGFPQVKAAIDNSKKFLLKNGYVEDFMGRRRHLPEVYLPAYEVKLKDPKIDLENFNPFLVCEDRVTVDPKIKKWQDQIDAAVQKTNEIGHKYNKDFVSSDEMSVKKYKDLVAEALADGVIITSNTGKRAQAGRQCFNSRIQGSAATLTKMAMVNISRDQVLNECGAKLIIPVHDELLVECPEYYSEIVEKRLPEVMIEAAATRVKDVPMKCDPANEPRWYSSEYAVLIQEEFKKLEKKGIERDEALQTVIENHFEIPKEAIIQTIETGCDLDF